MNSINVNLLEYSWSADVILNGGQEISIWYTCWPSIRKHVKEVVAVYSDLPKEKVNQLFIC